MANKSETSTRADQESAEDVRVETEPGRGGPPSFDLDFVRGLIEAVDGSGIDSLEITRAGTRVKISKTPPSAGPAPTYVAASQPAAAPAPAPAAQSAPNPSAHSASAPASQEPEVAGDGAGQGGGASPEESGLVEVPSPMVGTFYRSPAPDAPPYVEVGTRVSKGQTLCILEAMKLMNELESELDGVVREVLVENAEPVEYGQALFRIDPNG